MSAAAHRPLQCVSDQLVSADKPSVTREIMTVANSTRVSNNTNAYPRSVTESSLERRCCYPRAEMLRTFVPYGWVARAEDETALESTWHLSTPGGSV